MLEESIASVPSIWASIGSWLTPTVLFVLLNLMIGTIALTSTFAAPKHPHQKQPQPQGLQLARSPSVLQRLKSINFYSYRSQEPTSEKPQDFDSHLGSQQTHLPDFYQSQQPQQPPLCRSPSMLQRLKSINFYSYLSSESVSTTNSIKTHETSHTLYDQKQSRPQNQEEEEEEEEEDVDEIEHQEPTLDEIYRKLQGNDKLVSRSNSDTKPSAGKIPTKLSRKMKKSASTKSAFSHFREDDMVVESCRPATVRERSKARVADVDDAEVDAKADDFINRFKQQLKLQRLDSIIRYKEMIGRGTGK